jgi:hypothetical protein
MPLLAAERAVAESSLYQNTRYYGSSLDLELA